MVPDNPLPTISPATYRLLNPVSGTCWRVNFQLATGMYFKSACLLLEVRISEHSNLNDVSGLSDHLNTSRTELAFPQKWSAQGDKICMAKLPMFPFPTFVPFT